MRKSKNRKHANLSLSREYFYFASIVSILIFSSLVWLLWFSYYNLEEDNDRKYASEAKKIEGVLEDAFLYTSNLMKFIGTSIVASGKGDAESVARILQAKSESSRVKDDLFPWTLFEFINAEGYAVASTAGVTKPLKVDSRRRPWVITARTQPWMLHLTDPDVGIVSGDYIIPGGYGITDKEGKFLGIISIGFNAEKLKQKTEQVLSSHTDKFLLFTKAYKLISSSEGDQRSFNELIPHLREKNIFLSESGKLESEIRYNGIVYKYYKVMRPYDYVILVGQDVKYLRAQLLALVMPQIVKTLVLGISFLILLYFFRIKIVNPMVLLSERAELLSRGNLDIEMPVVNSREASHLVKALEMVKMAFQRENSVRAQLFEANNKIKLSNASLEQKVVRRTKDLQRALDSKTEFLNNISHEIRTPIQGVTVLSEGLIGHWRVLADTKKLEIATHIASNSKRLLSLVGNLLDLSKFAAQKMLISVHRVEFNAVVECIIEECTNFGGREIKIEFVKHGDVFAVIDRERITQVLRNLFINAIKFSPDNGIIVAKVFQTKVMDDSGLSTSLVNVSISDEGIGIPENELKIIFEPFTQSTRTKTQAGGTGLGLAICQEIIARHHGKIWAENNKIKGSTFCFAIPLFQENETNNAKDLVKKMSMDDKEVRILIIDDEESCLLSMELLLYDTGYQLVKAESGIMGLQYLREHGDKVGLVLLDLMMPDMHGLDVLTEIKKQQNFAHIKVILQSGIADEEAIKDAYSMGAAGYIKKPYKKKAMLDQIKNVLSA